eukprot:1932450-Alexandrium_andersonii.AAC.1
MSASLVGSEMCIRDREEAVRCPAQGVPHGVARPDRTARARASGRSLGQAEAGVRQRDGSQDGAAEVGVRGVAGAQREDRLRPRRGRGTVPVL